VNVGRGKTVDEETLVEALKSERLSRAALDVFEEEPLPEESPLWELPNVILSPHSTDNVPGMTNELQSELFRHNLRRSLDGEPLVNELDKKLLY
jgi:phosphoglycerate dehydrogenase-like enzyme